MSLLAVTKTCIYQWHIPPQIPHPDPGRLLFSVSVHPEIWEGLQLGKDYTAQGSELVQWKLIRLVCLGSLICSQASSMGPVSNLSLFTLHQEQALERQLNPQSQYCRLWLKGVWDSLSLTQGGNRSWLNQEEGKRSPGQCHLTWRGNAEKTGASIVQCLGNARSTGLSLFPVQHLTTIDESFLSTYYLWPRVAERGNRTIL